MEAEKLELRDKRETLARVARILRGQEPPPMWRDKPVGFEMANAFVSSRECGAVCCIGGTAWLLENPDTNDHTAWLYTVHDRDLRELYFAMTEDGAEHYADDERGEGPAITAAQAANAIDNYLSTGRPNWDAILAGQPAP